MDNNIHYGRYKINFHTIATQYVIPVLPSYNHNFSNNE